MPRGLRLNQWVADSGARRAVNMLLAKVKGETFQTEVPLAKFDRVPIAAPIKELSKITIALVTEGGLVPSGNPDRLETSKASNYYCYSIEHMTELQAGSFQSVHGGYNTCYVNQDPNRLVPVDVFRELERDGIIGKLHNFIYTTTGNQTTIKNGQKFGNEIAQQLRDAQVSAAILTSTWGTGTRCGATIVKEIERAGIPIVLLCNLVSTGLNTGANRIVPTVAITHPLGNPDASASLEKTLRKKIVMKALRALQTDLQTQTVFEEDVAEVKVGI